MDTNHTVTLECRVDAELVLQAYLRNHDVVTLLELVHAVIDSQSDPEGDSRGQRHYRAASMLDELLDAV